MTNYILNLEDGQTLRIFPFDKFNLFDEYNFYHIENVGDFILDRDTNIVFTDRLPRVVRNFYLVEYNNRLWIIKTAMRIRHIINDYFSDDSGQSFYTPEHLLDCFVGLNVSIQMTSGFPNYDKSQVVQFVTDHMNDNNVDNLFESDTYKELMDKFHNYITSKRLENNPTIIQKIVDKGLFKDNYQYLLRNIKINQFRERKINSSKTKLWNQVIKMVGETSHENKRIEDIGYLKENGEEVHQFMVDGYLFEVKLMDDVK